MSTTVRLPDGSRVSVPTDDPEQAAAAARRHWSQRQQAPKPRSAWQTAGDFLGDVVDNVIPNFGDEIAAIPDAARAVVKRQPVRAAWDRGRREFREHQARYDKDHPNLAWGSTLAGLGASLALPAGRVASGARMGAKMLHGAAVGAGYGALSGAGEGDTLSDRASNALTSAAIGGAFGAGATPVLAGAARAGRFVNRTVPGAAAATRGFLNVPRSVMRRPLRTARDDARDRADTMIHEALSQGNVSEGFGRNGPAASPTSIAAEVERRRAANVPAMPGDVTPQLRSLSAWSSRGEGPGQRMVRERLAARKDDEANRLRQHVVETLGPVGDPYVQMEAHTERARREAAPMYAEAYAQPMVLTPEIRSIIRTPAFQDAVPGAVRNIQNAQRDPEGLGFVMGDDGQMLPGAYQYLSTEGFDLVGRAMRDNGRTAAEVNPITGQIINNTNSVHINNRARDLRDQLAAQNGAYRDATSLYADELSQRDALEAGLKIGDRTGHEVNAWARQNPASAHPSFSIGARDFLADEASRVGAATPTANGAARLRKVLGDSTKQDALSAVMGDQSSIPALQNRLEAEHQGHMLWADVEGNSKTAMRQASEDSFNVAAGAPKGGFSWRGILMNAIHDVDAGVGERMRRDAKERVAEFTTEQDPAALRAMMTDIAAKSGRDREAAAARHRASVVGTKAYGANILPAYPSIYSNPVATDPEYADYEDDETVFDPGF